MSSDDDEDCFDDVDIFDNSPPNIDTNHILYLMASHEIYVILLYNVTTSLRLSCDVANAQATMS